MLDVLLIPAVLLVALALRAVRRGAHRLHGYLMTAAFTVVALRMLLRPRAFPPGHLETGLAVLGLAGGAMILGRGALAWREDRSRNPQVPRFHRALGTLTLVSFALALVFWLLRDRA
jgi:hypothetical protein